MKTPENNPTSSTPAPLNPLANILAALKLPDDATGETAVLAINNLQSQLAAAKTEIRTRTGRGEHSEADDALIAAKMNTGMSRTQAVENLRLQRAQSVPPAV